MSTLCSIILIVTGIIALFLLLNVINIIQAGSKKPHNRSMEDIIGKNPAHATYDDIEKLSRKEKMQVFIAASTPKFTELNGEYKALLLSGGILGKSSELFTHHVFPTGGITLHTKWVGKAFKPLSDSSGIGYNIFEEKTKTGTKILRLRKIETSIGLSKIAKDGKDSFHIDYSKYNKGTVHSMRDEIRKINDNLYIGMGYMGLGGGSANPAPFVLVGKPSSWVGPDDE
ncbi:MAG: hypothetical protein N3F66_12470 [Spirochaetes bacterium]|nr:hypothetical protein [Spirochaetota bacterium]